MTQQHSPIVLLVNDLPEPLTAMQYLLEAAGYTVITAGDGRAGLEAARRYTPDLIISDVVMPVMDGIEMCRALRADTSHHLTPVLLMTGNRRDSASAVEALNAGADEYIELPYDPVRLVATVARHIERKRTAEAMRDSEARYRLVSETATDVILTIDEDDTIKFVNASIERVFGYRRDEVIGCPATMLMADSLRAAHMSGLRRYVQTGERRIAWEALQVTGRHRGGRDIPLEMSLAESHISGRRLFTAIIRDVSERQRAADELQAQLDFNRAITGSLGEGVYTLDRNGRLTFMNPAAERLLGWTQSELLGCDMHGAIHSRHADGTVRPADQCALLSVLTTGETVTIDDDVFTCKDGSLLPVSYNSSPIVTDGHVVGAVLAFHDTTQQRRAAEALRRSEERYRDLVENARDIISSIDLEGNITSVNSVAEQIMGYSRAELLQLNLSRLIAPDHLERVQQEIAGVIAGAQRTHYEADVITKDGRRVPIEVTCRLVRHTGVPVAVHAVSRDVTERKQLEASLLHAQKMEAVGVLAAGVAHDFNNVLTTIICLTQLTFERLPEGDPLRPDIIEIERAAERAATLTRQLLAFSRRQVLSPRVVDLNDIVRGIDSMLRRLLGEDVELVATLGSSLPCMVKADPGQLEQVIMNLAVNARDAMPSGGRLTIDTLATEANVILQVRDNGIGMDAAVRTRIFEPFYTTKPPGRGTGLGLSIVYGIVEQSGGHIGVETAPGQGTAFTITLPRTSESIAPARAESPHTQRRGSGTVVLVEDDASVRQVCSVMLRTAGYHVLEAAEPGAAVHLVRTNASVRLVITDMVLPGIHGRDLAECITKMRDDISIIYMSGYTDARALPPDGSSDVYTYLQKPFSKEVLLRAVDAAMGAQIVSQGALDAPAG